MHEEMLVCRKEDGMKETNGRGREKRKYGVAHSSTFKSHIVSNFSSLPHSPHSLILSPLTLSSSLIFLMLPVLPSLSSFSLLPLSPCSPSSPLPLPVLHISPLHLSTLLIHFPSHSLSLGSVCHSLRPQINTHGLKKREHYFCLRVQACASAPALVVTLVITIQRNTKNI